MNPVRICLALTLASLFLSAAAVAQAQLQIQPLPGMNAPGRGAGNTVIFREDRNVNRAIDKAREAIEAESYDEAVHILGDVLKIGEDFFYRRDGADNLVSIKSEVRRLLGSMPGEGRQRLELRHGAEARRMLEQALAAGDWTAVADVAARYFHTQAGYEATWLLALHHRDTGQPLAAALTLRQLADAPAEVVDRFQPTLSFLLAASWLGAGMDGLAAQELAALKAKYPEAQVQLGDRRVPLLPPGQEPLNWLAAQVSRGGFAERATEQWLVHRGAPSRNQGLPIHSPVVSTAWRAPAYDDFVDVNGELGEPHLERGVRSTLKEIEQLALRHGEPLLPATHPLVVGDTVVFRTATQLVAVDAVTGKRAWTGAVDQQLQERLRVFQPAASPKDGNQPVGPAGNDPPAPGARRRLIEQRSGAAQAQLQIASGLMARMLGDAAYGTLASDGDQVFAIEDIGFSVMHPQYQRMRGMGRRAASYNTLRAYEVASGKLKWELGGEPGDFELELAGNWFLGPPLPLGGLLYALVEKDDEIRLACIDHHAPEGKRLLWSQSLCVVEQDYVGVHARRTAGVSPSFADGVLVCPTASGAVVAVDLTSRSLLWAFQYPADPSPEVRQRRLVPTTGALYSSSGWSDVSVTIYRGCVLLTPPGSSRFYALNLLDGAPLWEPIERGDAMYVAGGYNGKVILVGPSSVRAVDLESGRTDWRSQFPKRQFTAGRGYQAGDTYVVPLADSTLAQVRLDSGDVAIRPLGGSVADDRHTGNLIAVGDRVFCQHLYGCDSYTMVSPDSLQQRLQTNPGDAEAWLIQGDMQLQQGHWKDAAQSLRKAITSGSANARDLLAECLLRQLKADFTQHPDLAPELEKLIGHGPLAGRYWQTVAEGFAAEGDGVAAARAYLRLAVVEVPGEGDAAGHIKEIEPSLSVRQDRLVATRLHQLWKDAGAAERKAIDEIIHAEVELLVGATATEPGGESKAGEVNPAALRQAIDYFGWHPAALPVKWQLVRQLQADDERPLLDVDLVLNAIAVSAQAPDQAQALAALAETYSQARRWEAAVWYATQLKERFGDTVLADGRKAAVVAAQVLEHSDASSAVATLAPASNWPAGQVKARSATAQLAARGSRFLIHNVAPMPQFGEINIENENSQELIIRNARGELWRTRFRHPVSGDPIPAAQQGQSIAAYGRMMIVSTGCYLLAIDTVGNDRQAPGSIRWAQPMIDPYLAGSAGRMVALPRWEATDWGTRRVTLRSAHSDLLGTMQPVVGRQVTFVRGTQLISLDAAKGQPLWIRDGIVEGSEVFGDEECIYVAPPDQPRALVFRTADGTSLPPQRVPPWSQRMRTLGRKILAWSKNGQQVTVRLFDPATQQDEWTRTFDRSAKAAFADDGRLGVVQSDGRFQLLDVLAGETVIDSQVDVPESLAAVYVLKHHDRYLLAATRTAQGQMRQQNGWMVRPFQVPSMEDSPAIHGFLHGFDEQGRLAWSQPAQNVALPLNQPSASPVLCLMSYVYGTRVMANGRSVVQQSCLVFVDKRNGRVVHRQLLPGVPRVHEQTVDADKHMVEFSCSIGTVHLEWTDEAWPKDAEMVPIEPELPEPLPGGGQPRPRVVPQRQPAPRPQPIPQPRAQPREAPAEPRGKAQPQEDGKPQENQAPAVQPRLVPIEVQLVPLPVGRPEVPKPK